MLRFFKYNKSFDIPKSKYLNNYVLTEKAVSCIMLITLCKLINSEKKIDWYLILEPCYRVSFSGRGHRASAISSPQHLGQLVPPLKKILHCAHLVFSVFLFRINITLDKILLSMRQNKSFITVIYVN